MPYWENWKRLRVDDPANLTNGVYHQANKLLGELMEQLALTGLFQATLRRRLADGTLLVARFDGTLPIIEVKGVTSLLPTLLTAQQTDIWIPRGFILYPCSDTSPNGWGTPVLPAGGTPAPGPYDAPNLAPGLDVSRWTTNGRLGEVLLTQVSGAGYPDTQKLLAPYMASANTGAGTGLQLQTTYQLPSANTSWSPYRMAFTAFTAQSPGTDTIEQLEIIQNKIAFFETVNAHRVSLGLTPFLLPIRGRFDSAQATAEVCYATSTLGHHFQGFSIGYRASSDRTAKDGLIGYVSPTTGASRDVGNDTAEEEAVGSSTVVASQLDPSGFDTVTVTNALDISAQYAFDRYLGEPKHKLGLEAKQWNGWHTSIQYGFRHAFQAAHFFPNTAWVNAGNRFWNSQYAEIPTLSWFGFASLSLAYETYPVSYNNHYEIARPANPPSEFDPLTPFFGFTPNDQCWLATYYAYDPGFVYGQVPDASFDFSAEQVPYVAPALDNRIFLRGRCIAIAPPIPGGTNAGLVWAAAIQKFDNVYRLVALVHHPEDQPADWKTYGMTSYLRVWYCDMPNDGPIPCAPHSIAREAFGFENHSWPWDIVDSPYSWQGGFLIDVGTTDGITRDSLKYASQWIFSSDAMKAICLRDQGLYAAYSNFWDYYGSDTQVFQGQIPRALELTFGGNQFSALTVNSAWYGANAGSTPYSGVSNPTFTVATPLAAGYDANNAPSFALAVNVGTPGISGPGYLVFDTYNAQPSLGDGVHYADTIQTMPVGPGETNAVASLNVCVLDVKDQVFLWSGRISGSNNCPINTSLPVGAVSVWRQGQLLGTQEFANPDNVVPFLQLLNNGCAGNAFYTVLQLSNTSLVVPSYASNGTDWVCSYVIVPQAETCFVAVNPQPTCNDCTGPGMAVVGSAGLLTVSPQPPYNFKPVCRGRWMTSSIGNLGALTQTLGSNAGTLYARVA